MKLLLFLKTSEEDCLILKLILFNFCAERIPSIAYLYAKKVVLVVWVLALQASKLERSSLQKTQAIGSPDGEKLTKIEFKIIQNSV